MTADELEALRREHEELDDLNREPAERCARCGFQHLPSLGCEPKGAP